MDKTKIMVEFCAYSENFNPEEITKSLGILPDKIWRRGEVINKHGLERKENCWSIKTGYQESLDINEQLDYILSIIVPHINMLVDIKKRSIIEYKIDIVINIENGQTPAICLKKEVLKFLNKIEAELDIDMYVFS